MGLGDFVDLQLRSAFEDEEVVAAFMLGQASADGVTCCLFDDTDLRSGFRGEDVLVPVGDGRVLTEEAVAHGLATLPSEQTITRHRNGTAWIAVLAIFALPEHPCLGSPRNRRLKDEIAAGIYRMFPASLLINRTHNLERSQINDRDEVIDCSFSLAIDLLQNRRHAGSESAVGRHEQIE